MPAAVDSTGRAPPFRGASFLPRAESRGKPMGRRPVDGMNPYELMYLVQPTADEERLTAIGERIQQAITGAGGKIEKVNVVGRRRLSYKIDRFRDGIYIVVDFQLAPNAAREVDRTIKLQEEILRHIIIRRDEN